ncbi:MAG: hypothetical protein ACMUHX_05050 [bacterium]
MFAAVWGHHDRKILTRLAWGVLPSFISMRVSRARTSATRVKRAGDHARISSAHNKPACQHRPIRLEHLVSLIRRVTGTSGLARLISTAFKKASGAASAREGRKEEIDSQRVSSAS